MVCKHCGKEFSDEFKYCPYCAEPVKKAKAIEVEKLTEEEQLKRVHRGANGRYFLFTIVVGVFWFLFGFLICQFLGWYIYPDTLGNDAVHDKTDTFAIIVWVSILIGWFLLRWIILKLSSENQNQKRIKKYIITSQYLKDRTSICPYCGSHDIKVYRKGYNYKIGFWGAIFGVRGSGYAGGFDANKTCCHCMDCGKDWETDYDYRTINK